MTIAGGDPYLWPHLEETVRLFRETDIFSRNVYVFTGMISDELTRRLDEAGAQITFSYYGKEPDYRPDCLHIDYSVKDHFVLPKQELWETLPADCICSGPNIRAGRVWRCSNVPDLLLADHKDADDPAYSEPLTSQYLDQYYGLDLYSDRYCALCVGNLKLRPLVPLESNIAAES